MEKHIIVGDSTVIIVAKDNAVKAARTGFSALILGERGTGKELFARFIHKNSSRADKPFIAVNCAAIPESMMDSELLGVGDKVATGVNARAGVFEAADGGTIFLDEIADMPPTAQAKILRVVQEREVTRIGCRKSIPVDVRMIAATNKVKEIYDGGEFRADLLDRLNEIPLVLPPLRERGGDVMLLFRHFMGVYRHLPQIKRTASSLLDAYRWPGNVRELEALTKRIVAFEGDRRDLTEKELLRIKPELRPMAAPPSQNEQDAEKKDRNAADCEDARRDNLLGYLRTKGAVSRSEYQKLAGVSASTALRDLRRLVESEVVMLVGKARASKYVLR